MDDVRTGEERFHGLRSEHLPRPGKIADAIGDAHGQAQDVVGPDLHLTRMDTGPHLEANGRCP